MKILRDQYNIHGIKTPCIRIEHEQSHGDIILIHGYGGCKEEMLGLGFRLSESGYSISVIDLKGHGENTDPFDMTLLDQVESIIAALPHKNRIAIGHSLGGRLALLSQANIRIGISPALNKSFSEQTVRLLKNMRQYRVRAIDENINFTLLNTLPKVEISNGDLILYGSRDILDIIESATKMNKNIRCIKDAMHGDICFLEDTFTVVKDFISGHTTE